MSYVNTSSGSRRPAYSHDLSNTCYEACQLQMLESIRNAIESLGVTLSGLQGQVQGIRSCPSVTKAFRDLDAVRRNTTKKRKRREPNVRA